LVFSVMLGIRRDRPRCRIEIKVCLLAGLQEVILRFLFHQNRLSGFVAVGGGAHNLPFPIDFTKSVGKRPNRLRKFRQLASSVHNVARAGCESSGLNKSSSNWVKSDKICNRAFELYAIFLLPHFLQSTS